MLLGLVRAVLSKITQFREVPTSVIKLVIAGLTNNRKGFNILWLLSETHQNLSKTIMYGRLRDFDARSAEIVTGSCQGIGISTVFSRCTTQPR